MKIDLLKKIFLSLRKLKLLKKKRIFKMDETLLQNEMLFLILFEFSQFSV